MVVKHELWFFHQFLWLLTTNQYEFLCCCHSHQPHHQEIWRPERPSRRMPSSAPLWHIWKPTPPELRCRSATAEDGFGFPWGQPGPKVLAKIIDLQKIGHYFDIHLGNTWFLETPNFYSINMKRKCIQHPRGRKPEPCCSHDDDAIFCHQRFTLSPRQLFISWGFNVGVKDFNLACCWLIMVNRLSDLRNESLWQPQNSVS